jgi:hypothetical protein
VNPDRRAIQAFIPLSVPDRSFFIRKREAGRDSAVLEEAAGFRPGGHPSVAVYQKIFTVLGALESALLDSAFRRG